jgi:aminoglycoside/choline kinase family phosphotransferase
MTADLGEALTAEGMDVARIEPLAGDVSKRRYYRVWGTFGTRTVCVYPESFDTRQSASERWVSMCTANPEVRHSFNSDPLAYIETTDWFTRCGIPVPKLFSVNGEKGFMVMEDVGDSSLESLIREMETPQIVALYRRVMAYLDLLSGSTAEAYERDILGCHMKLDHAKLITELEFLQGGVRRLPAADLPLPPPVELNDELNALCEVAASGTLVLCHRDYHSRNLYVTGKTIYVLDHQDLRLGHRFYDRASLLWDPYVHVPEALKDEFWRSIAPGEREELRAVAAQRLLKALGTYLTVLLNDGPRGFLVAATAALRDLTILTRSGPGPSMEKTYSLLLAVEQRLEILHAQERDQHPQWPRGMEGRQIAEARSDEWLREK